MNLDTHSTDQLKIPESVELFEFLLEHIPDLIFFKDRNHRFICVNRAMLDIFGLKEPGEIIGKTDFDFLLSEDARRTQEDEQHVLQTGEPIMGHVTKKMHVNGTPWWALTTKLPLRDTKGDIVGTCGISKDITSLKEAEDALARTNNELERALAELKAVQTQLISAEKSQSVARLAAGVAHEVRNPLNILSTGLGFISSETAAINNSTLAIVIKEMQAAISRADNVICTLMESSSPAGLRLEESDINAMIEGAFAGMAGKLEAADVRVTKEFSAELPLVKTDTQKMRQVLEGIFSNAIEAMPDGGDLKISTRLEELTPEDITRDAGNRSGRIFRAGDQVVTIEVEDTGTGIPNEVLPRIFDPFFTTKDTGATSSLGLGLTICRAIIELHGGSLEIANKGDRQGTRAILKLKSFATP